MAKIILTNWDALVQTHAKLSEEYPETAYFELCSTRRTGWAGYLCSELVDNNPNRIRFALAQENTCTKTINSLLSIYAKERNQKEITYSANDKNLKEIHILEDKLRNVHNFHYLYFLMTADPKKGFNLLVTTHEDLDREDTETLVDFTSKDNNFLEQVTQKLKEAIKNL